MEKLTAEQVQLKKIEFVRDSATQRDFNGRWQVWIDADYFGIVRQSADPIKIHEAWGYESVPCGPYPNGQQCDGGFATRLAAAEYLVELVQTPAKRSLPRLREAVVTAAKAFVREVESPAPDLVLRAKLREDLQTAVRELETEEHRHG